LYAQLKNTNFCKGEEGNLSLGEEGVSPSAQIVYVHTSIDILLHQILANTFDFSLTSSILRNFYEYLCHALSSTDIPKH